MRKLAIIVFLFAMLLASSTVSAPPDCAPEDAVAAFEAGSELLDKGLTNKGLLRLEEAVTLYPDFEEAWQLLDQRYSQLGRYEDAIRAVENIRRLNPGLAAQYDGLIGYYEQQSKVPPAAVLALERCRQHPVASKKAIKACKEAIRLYPEYAEAHYFLGVNYLHGGEKELALAEVLRTVELDPAGAGGMLVHVLLVVQPEWFSAEFEAEVQQHMAAAAPVSGEPARPAEYARFTSDEVTTLLAASAPQIAAIERFLADLPALVPGDWCGGLDPALRAELRRSMTPPGIVSIKANRPYCGSGGAFSFFDSDRAAGLAEIEAIATDLGIGDVESQQWRIGKLETRVREQYCRPVCSVLFEYRIDARIHGKPIELTVLAESPAGLGELGECSGLFGDGPRFVDW